MQSDPGAENIVRGTLVLYALNEVERMVLDFVVAEKHLEGINSADAHSAVEALSIFVESVGAAFVRHRLDFEDND